MIAEAFVREWAQKVPWQSIGQVEQDMVICRALVELYSDTVLGDSLVFRGGTALNKLYMAPGVRYSEDIDLVQRRAEGIGETIDRIREVFGVWLGEPKWKVTGRSAKMVFGYETVEGMPAKLKIEINTTEHFQVLPLISKAFEVESGWFSGSAEVLSYELEELMATKLRALYQRRKGRDLFDMWYVLEKGALDMDRVIEIFGKYCEHEGVRISKKEFEKNMELKKENRDFKVDMGVLLPVGTAWDFEKAYEAVMSGVIARL